MINSFRGEHFFLSNFYDCPVAYGGRMYLNSESAYQAQKFPDEGIRASFESTPGGVAKKFAKIHKSKGLQRPDWHQVSLGLMVEIVHAKFTQNKDLRQKLVLTYPQELIEGNDWWDRFWGVCQGQGSNWLGRILMAERAYWLDLTNNETYYKDDRLVPAFEASLKQAV